MYCAKDSAKKKKYYALIEFPYPSGDGLHVGHPRPYIGMDIIARKRRMRQNLLAVKAQYMILADLGILFLEMQQWQSAHLIKS